MKLHESNIILVNFHTRLQSTGFVVVLVLVLDKILILEDEYDDENEHDKHQIRLPASAPFIKLQFLLRSDWPRCSGVSGCAYKKLGGKGINTDEIAVQAKDRGAFGCLGKPFDFEELRQNLQQAVTSDCNSPSANCSRTVHGATP